MRFKKLLLSIFFFSLIFPLQAWAEEEECASYGGQCVPWDSCSDILSELYYCPDGEVCCESSQPDSADPYSEGSTSGFLVFKGHIVPCGRSTDDAIVGKELDETQECTLCHLFIMLKNIFDLMLSLLIIVAILFIVIAGIIYIVSAGNSSMIEFAKKILKKTLIGFALMLAGWLLVYTLLVFLKAEDMIGSGGKWYEFDCDLESKFQGEGAETIKTGEPDDTDYTYDPEIESQLSDASDELKVLLNCMKDKLPAEAKRISSISDSEGMDNCKGDNWTSDCAHKKNSCHYGGTECIGLSYAVDFGEESYASQIEQVAEECDSGANVYKEDTHTHVSIGETNGCNCISNE
jgi:hypothetical protein